MGAGIYTKSERAMMAVQPAAANSNRQAVHEIANLWPAMADDEWAEFLEDIRTNGLIDPIITWRGSIVDGKHRYRACCESGQPPRFDALPDDWDEWRVVTYCSSKHRRRNLTTAQRNAVAAEAIEKYKAKPQERQLMGTLAPVGAKGKAAAEAARDMGGSERGVERAMFVRENAPEVHDLVKAGKLSGLQAERLAKEPDSEKRAAKLKQLDTAARSDNDGDSWGTPPEWIELARGVMGDIDLDPASNEIAQRTVRAGKFFNRDTNGLDQAWAGRVWMNPPYSQPLVTQFAEKLVSEFEAGNVTQACVLVNNATDTRFVQHMLAHCTAALFPKGRVSFLVPDSGEALTGTRQGQVFLYFGKNVSALIKHAGGLGWIGVSP